jgi:hypothetical protein
MKCPSCGHKMLRHMHTCLIHPDPCWFMQCPGCDYETSEGIITNEMS